MTVMYINKDGKIKFSHSGEVEIFSSYTHESYGVIGEESDIKDTLTGDYLKVGDIVFIDSNIKGMASISVVVKSKDPLDEEPVYFVMGYKLPSKDGQFFKHIIKTNSRLDDLNFKRLGYSLYLKEPGVEELDEEK